MSFIPKPLEDRVQEETTLILPPVETGAKSKTAVVSGFMSPSDQSGESPTIGVPTQSQTDESKDGLVELSSQEMVCQAPTEKEQEQLLQEQLRFCGVVLKGLRRHRSAHPFLAPVDHVALNIPDYFDIIKNPMDLSTIQTKHGERQYKTPEEFIGDVNLMFGNCFLYNAPETFVHRSGQALEKYFMATMEKLPRALQKTAPNRSSREVELVRQVQKPRRVLEQRLSVSDVSICNGVLRELGKKKNQAIVYPFLLPVDPVALGVPDYFDVIKEPMDISTIKRNLEERQYGSTDEFFQDMKKIVENCFAYNHPGTVVYEAGVDFEKLLTEAWTAAHEEQRGRSNSPKPKKARKSGTGSEVDIKEELQWRLSQVDLHQTRILELRQRLGLLGSQKTQKKTGEGEQPITREEKLKMAEAVEQFEEADTDRVLSVIKNHMSSLLVDDENPTIEIDLDNLSTAALRDIQKCIDGIQKRNAANKAGLALTPPLEET